MTNLKGNVFEGKIKGPLMIGDPLQFENKEFHKFLFAAKLDHNIKLQVVQEEGTLTAIVNLLKEGETQAFSFDEDYDPVLPVSYKEWKLFTDTAEFKVYCEEREYTISTMTDGYFGFAFANDDFTEYMIYLYIPDDVSDFKRYEDSISYVFGLKK